MPSTMKNPYEDYSLEDYAQDLNTQLENVGTILEERAQEISREQGSAPIPFIELCNYLLRARAHVYSTLGIHEFAGKNDDIKIFTNYLGEHPDHNCNLIIEDFIVKNPAAAKNWFGISLLYGLNDLLAELVRLYPYAEEQAV